MEFLLATRFHRTEFQSNRVDVAARERLTAGAAPSKVMRFSLTSVFCVNSWSTKVPQLRTPLVPMSSLPGLALPASQELDTFCVLTYIGHVEQVA